MNKYVSTNKLKAKIISGEPVLFSEATQHEIFFLLESEPSEDVEPVVHAHWIRTAIDYGNIGYIRCSNCGADFSLPVHKMQGFYQRYCGTCGAKMDEEKNEVTK